MIFKIGDRVYDWSEGDVGVIKQAHYDRKIPMSKMVGGFFGKLGNLLDNG